MKHVNGDMDDLFRRAAEKYPLRTDSSDWDRLAADLDQAPDSPDPEAGDKRRRRRVFWWFLLLPLGGLGYFAWQPFTHARQTTPSAATHSRVAGAGSAADAGSPVTSGAASHATTTTTRGAATPGTPAAGTKTAPNGGVAAPTGSTGSAAPGHPGSPLAVHLRAPKPSAEAPGGLPPRSAKALREGEQAMPAIADASRAGHKHHRTSTAPGLTGRNNDQEGPGATQYDAVTGTRLTGKGNDQGGNPRTASLNLHRVPTAGDYHLLVDVKAPATPVDSTSRGNRKKTTAAAKKSSHAYVGIFGSPDLSTVKLQAMKGVGTTFGVLVGYALNDKWAIESGIYLDRKKYYTAGEYFSTKNINLTPGVYIESANGTCNMWEIPLNVRYNFSTGQKMKWFATAGLSTYLMSKEHYDDELSGGNGYSWPSSWNYDHPYKYFFSVLNVSAGFEQRLGKIGNLRLEPYLRIPLSGIGTGRLPIMSAGLNIGITRQLW